MGGDAVRWWERAPRWGTGWGATGASALGYAHDHLWRAGDALRGAQPRQWRASSAQAFAGRLANLARDVQSTVAFADEAADRVRELEAEVAAARALLCSAPPSLVHR